MRKCRCDRIASPYFDEGYQLEVWFPILQMKQLKSVHPQRLSVRQAWLSIDSALRHAARGRDGWADLTGRGRWAGIGDVIPLVPEDFASRSISASTTPAPKGHCVGCGYDLLGQRRPASRVRDIAFLTRQPFLTELWVAPTVPLFPGRRVLARR